MIKFYSTVLGSWITPVFRKDWIEEHRNQYNFLCIETPHNYLKDKLGPCAYSGKCTEAEANNELRMNSHLWRGNMTAGYICSGVGTQIYGFIKIDGLSLYSEIWRAHQIKRGFRNPETLKGD